MVELSDGKSLRVYPVIGVFGANASGKSNVITALKKMQQAVVDSYGRWTSYAGIPDREPFALDSKSSAESTFYEADFVLDDGVRWTYGFRTRRQTGRVSAHDPHACAQPRGNGRVHQKGGGRAVSDRLTWFKSSYSDSQGSNCLEAARTPERVHIRDSKLGPQSPTFTAAAPAWNAFLAHARTA